MAAKLIKPITSCCILVVHKLRSRIDQRNFFFLFFFGVIEGRRDVTDVPLHVNLLLMICVRVSVLIASFYNSYKILL